MNKIKIHLFVFFSQSAFQHFVKNCRAGQLSLHINLRPAKVFTLLWIRGRDEIWNLSFSLNLWLKNGSMHQLSYHLLQSNPYLSSGACLQVFQKCQSYSSAAHSFSAEFFFSCWLPASYSRTASVFLILSRTSSSSAVFSTAKTERRFCWFYFFKRKKSKLLLKLELLSKSNIPDCYKSHTSGFLEGSKIYFYLVWKEFFGRGISDSCER